MIHTPPTRANGRESITIAASVTVPKVRYKRSAMIPSVSGTTTWSRALTRCIASYCPLQRSQYPCGSESRRGSKWWSRSRSEEHTSELQSRLHLVCRLLLEKKKTQNNEVRRT